MPQNHQPAIYRRPLKLVGCVNSVFSLVASFAHGVCFGVESFFLSFVALSFSEVGLLFKRVFLRFVLLLNQIFLSFLLAFCTASESCESECRSDERCVLEFHLGSPFSPQLAVRAMDYIRLKGQMLNAL